MDDQRQLVASADEQYFRSWVLPMLLFPIVAVVPLVQFLRVGALAFAVATVGVVAVSIAAYAVLYAAVL